MSDFIQDLITEKYNNFLQSINMLIQLNKLKGDIKNKKDNIKLYLDEFDNLKKIKYQEKDYVRGLNTSQCENNFNEDSFYLIELGQNPQGYFYTSVSSIELVYQKIFFVEDTNKSSIIKYLTDAYSLLETLYYGSEPYVYYTHGSIDETSINWTNISSVKTNLLDNLNSAKTLIENYKTLLNNNLTFFNNIKNGNNTYISISDLDSTEDWSGRISTLDDYLTSLNTIISYINNSFSNPISPLNITNNIDISLNTLKTNFTNLNTILNTENGIKIDGNFWVKFKFWIKQYIDKNDGVLLSYNSFDNLKNQNITKRNNYVNEIKTLNNNILPNMPVPTFLTYNDQKEEEPILVIVKDIENNKIKFIINYVWSEITATTKYDLTRTLKIKLNGEGDEIILLDNNIKIFTITNDNDCIKNDKGEIILPKKPITNYQEIVELTPLIDINLVTNVTITSFAISIKCYHEPIILENFGNIQTYDNILESDEHIITIINKIIQL